MTIAEQAARLGIPLSAMSDMLIESEAHRAYDRITVRGQHGERIASWLRCHEAALTAREQTAESVRRADHFGYLFRVYPRAEPAVLTYRYARI